jgi:hypothetical protein
VYKGAMHDSVGGYLSWSVRPVHFLLEFIVVGTLDSDEAIRYSLTR